MPGSSYRIYLGAVVDISYSDEEQAVEVLAQLSNATPVENPSSAPMSAIDRLSAYIAMNFQNAMFDEVLRMPGIGVFYFDPLQCTWCCNNEHFGHIAIKSVEALNVQGIGVL